MNTEPFGQSSEHRSESLMCLPEQSPRPHKREEPFAELAIMSRPSDLANGSPGHILAAISVAGKGEEAWGYYESGVLDEFIEAEPVEGHKNYSLSDYNRVVVIPLSEDQHRKIDAWRRDFDSNGSYSKFTRNCTDFVREVVNLAGHEAPSSVFPDSLGRELEKNLGIGGVRCLGAPRR